MQSEGLRSEEIHQDWDTENRSIDTIENQLTEFQQGTYQQGTIKNYQNFFPRDLKDWFIGINMKRKVMIKIRQMNLQRNFLKSNFVGVNRFLVLFIQIMVTMLKDLMLENIICQKT